MNPKDADANFEIASLFEISEPKTALVYYENGLKIKQGEFENDPEKIIQPELFLNIGVLRLEVGKEKESVESFEKAIQVCNQILEVNKEDKRVKAIKITAKFNLGYCFEMSNEYGKSS